MSVDLADINIVKSVLARHGFAFSKSLGQNFLIDSSVCPRMADAAAKDKSYGVLEVGPGIGVLTSELSKRAEKVVSVELDKRLLPVLHETLCDCNNVEIVNDDILKLDLKKLISEKFADCSEVTVCANLPYYITSPVIMKLLSEQLPLKKIVVMVQKEAAERICAEPGTRDVGAVSIAVRYYAEPEMLFKVSAGSFVPPPKVDSEVIKLDILAEPPIKPKDEKQFFRLVKSAFAQRRKTLSNSLSSGLGVSKSDIAQALESCGLKPTARAEELSMQDFCKLADYLL